MNGYWTIYFSMCTILGENGCTPRLFVAGASISKKNNTPDIYGYVAGGGNAIGKYKATSTQAVEFYCYNLRSNAAGSIAGGVADETHFVAQFNRVY
jgi:hypothetical protein